MLISESNQAQNSSGESKKKMPKKKIKSAPKLVTGHPDHSAHIKRLNRVKGQIEGIERMILDRRYCPDIIAQLKAASAGLRATEAEVLKAHLRGCVRSALAGKDAFQSEEKIQEIIKMVF